MIDRLTKPVHLSTLIMAVLLPIVLSACNSGGVRSDDAKSRDFSALNDPGGRLEYATVMPSASKEESALRGDAALASGDRKRALYEYLDALGKGGADASLLYKVGRIHLGMGNRTQAELAFRFAQTADPEHLASLQELSLLQIHRREFAVARKNLERVVAGQPGAAKAHNALGVLADMQGQHEEAQDHYTNAIRSSGGVPSYLNNLGYSYYMAGDLGRAEQAFIKALDRNPAHERAWRNLALVYSKSGRYMEALNALRKTGEIHEAYNDLGYVVMLTGDYEKASQFLEEAIRLSPSHYELADRNRQRLKLMRTGQPVE